MLADKQQYWNKNKKMLQTTPAQYKQSYPYLKEVDSLALANVQIQLQQAFKNHYSHPSHFGRPKFKSKKHCRKESYTTNCNHGSITIGANFVKLPKVGKVKAKIHRTPKKDWILKSATISRTASGKHFVSCLFAISSRNAVLSDSIDRMKAIGLDYKSDGFYTSSEGNMLGSPKYYRKAQAKLAKEQRRLSRKKKDSNNYWKQKKKVAKVQEHIANQRNDFTHKQSSTIAKQYDVICVETLDMKAIANKGFGNGKATLDNGWGMFVAQLQYKAKREGKLLIKIDKWFPSSQICHTCGARHPELKDLSIRQWDCPDCGTHHDRDINAALNIRDEGLHLLDQQNLAVS